MSHDTDGQRPKIVPIRPDAVNQAAIDEATRLREKIAAVNAYYQDFFGFVPGNLLPTPGVSGESLFRGDDLYWYARRPLYDATDPESRRYSQGEIVTDVEQDVSIKLKVFEGTIALPSADFTDTQAIVLMKYSVPKTIKIGEYEMNSRIPSTYLNIYVFKQGAWYKRTFVYAEEIPHIEIPIGEEQVASLNDDIAIAASRVGKLVDLAEEATSGENELSLRRARKEDLKHFSSSDIPDALDAMRRTRAVFNQGLATREIRPWIDISWYHVVSPQSQQGVSIEETIPVPLEVTYIPSQDKGE